MSAHTRGPRSSRKPRPRAAAKQGSERGAADEQGIAATETAAQPPVQPPANRGQSRAASARQARVPAYRDFDERPQAPWHPLPLSELLILAGAIAFAIALFRLGHEGLASGGPLLLAGVLAVGLGTAEVSWREHRSGFRSHTLLLAFIPVLILHTVVVVGYSAFATPPRALNVGMLAVDAIVFALLARHLRAFYLDARARR